MSVSLDFEPVADKNQLAQYIATKASPGRYSLFDHPEREDKQLDELSTNCLGPDLARHASHSTTEVQCDPLEYRSGNWHRKELRK